MRRRSKSTVYLIALITVLAGEALIRAVDDRLVEPLDWYDATVQVRVERLDQLRDDDVSPQVVFVGSSSVANGLDPTTFAKFDRCGRVAFDAGATGATPTLLERWIVDGIFDRVDPATIVLGLTTRDVADGAGGRAWRGYQTAPATKPGAMATITRGAARRSELVHHRSLLRHPIDLWDAVSGRNPRLRMEDRAHTLDRFGFPDHDNDHDYAGIDNVLRREIDPFAMRGSEFDALRRIASVLDRRGVDLVIVLMPTSSDWAPSHGDGPADVDRFERAIRELAAVHQQPVVDLSDAVADREQFVDAIHLDLAGAKATTALLAERFPSSATCP